jgi:predicted ATP-dependent endonuclease of OLD family
MKLCKIAIKGFRQFQDVVLDFTHPETGAPLDKICFIGRNGTGKSTVLSLVHRFLHSAPNSWGVDGVVAIQFEIPEGRYWVVSVSKQNEFNAPPMILRMRISDHHPDWLQRLSLLQSPKLFSDFVKDNKSWFVEQEDNSKVFRELQLQDNNNDLLIYCPAETQANTYAAIGDVPNASVNDALVLFKIFPYLHEVSKGTVDSMWKTLVYLMKKRDSEWREFENREENAHRVLGEVKEEFNWRHPEILPQLAEFWNDILAQAGLEFDVEGASNPVQLTDNLHAYIRLKYGDKSRIPYSQLSTGIRNFIFTVGHIYLLYFGREIKRGFLLVDEPENSLFPDFLFDLMETYESIVRNKNGETGTQIFMATHNPIVAAQFEPYERIVLDWNDDGSVSARKGVAPKGDDPNDVLTKDFELTDLMGKAGLEKWKQYLELKSKARRSDYDVDKQMELESKASDIAREYGFPAPPAK